MKQTLLVATFLAGILLALALTSVAIADELDSPPTIDDIIEERYSVCTAHNAPRVWEFALNGFAENSSLLREGVPYAIEILGEPISSVRDESGGWDIDVYMIRRTLTFEGVKVVTYDFIDQGMGVDLATAEVEEALGLPCWPVARSGRLAARKLASYVYLASDPEFGTEYSVAFHFDKTDKTSSVVWALQLWH